jgi:hypothetical protein
MSVSAPFTPCGNTVTFTAANPAPSPVQSTSSTLGGNQYRIINSGNVTVFLGYGTTSALATAGAVTPTGSIANVLPLLPGTDEIITFVPSAYFTGNVASGTAVIYITAGDGC